MADLDARCRREVRREKRQREPVSESENEEDHKQLGGEAHEKSRQRQRLEPAEQRFDKVLARRHRSAHRQGGCEHHANGRFGHQARRLLELPDEKRPDQERCCATDQRIDFQQERHAQAGQRQMRDDVASEQHPPHQRERADEPRRHGEKQGQQNCVNRACQHPRAPIGVCKI